MTQGAGLGAIAQHTLAFLPSPERLAAALAELPGWDDGRTELSRLERFEDLIPWTPTAGLLTVLSDRAAMRGATRWGDATPDDVDALDVLARLLPGAVPIHVIRDGREVAAVRAGRPGAPGDGSAGAVAADWVRRVRRARALGAHTPGYREVRYERLRDAPGAVARELCVALELPWDPALAVAPARPPAPPVLGPGERARVEAVAGEELRSLGYLR